MTLNRPLQRQLQQQECPARIRGTGSQDESPRKPVHKFKGNFKGAQVKLAATKASLRR